MCATPGMHTQGSTGSWFSKPGGCPREWLLQALEEQADRGAEHISHEDSLHVRLMYCKGFWEDNP